jgi:hypothetical protein
VGGSDAAFRYFVRVDYQPMSITRHAAFIADEPDFDVRWRLVVEFLKEYHHEPTGERHRLLAGMPEAVGDERWDVLFAGLAEHLAMRDGQARAQALVRPRRSAQARRVRR